MKRVVIAVAVAVCMFGLASVAKADDNVKIGYVDFQKALNDVNEGKKAKAQLKTEFEAKQKQLADMEVQLKAMKDDLDKQRLVLSADALREKEENFRKKYMEYGERAKTYEMEFQTKQQKVTGDIVVRLQKIAAEIGQKDSYDIILEKSQVLYAPTKTDLTSRVIQDFNSGKGK